MSIAVSYFVIGAALAIWVLVRGLTLGGHSGMWIAILVGTLWPFLGPVVLNADEGPRRTTDGGRIDRLARAIDGAWGQLGSSWLRSQDKSAIDGFVRRLKLAEARAADIERASVEAPAAARESLARLREESLNEVARGVSLLEEMVAQLTVLRFIDRDVAISSERDRVEALLEAIGVDLSTSAHEGEPGSCSPSSP